jgi:hypothetical protein
MATTLDGAGVGLAVENSDIGVLDRVGEAVGGVAAAVNVPTVVDDAADGVAGMTGVDIGATVT